MVQRIDKRFIFVDGTEGEVVENQRHHGQAERYPYTEMATKGIWKHVEEGAEYDVKTYKKQWAENHHANLQHAVTEQKDGSKRHQGAEKQDAEEAPSGLISPIDSRNAQSLEGSLFQPVGARIDS